ERPRVLHVPLQRDHRIVRRPFADDLERLVDDPLGQRLLAPPQHLVDELGDQGVLVDRIRFDLAPAGRSLPWHPSPYALALAPYLDRAFLRSRTPAVSRVPRMILYRTPGRSRTRPARTSTMECSCRLWPMP